MVHGKVIDSATGKLVAARIYIQNESGEWFFPKSAPADTASQSQAHERASAVYYKKQRLRNPGSVEMHTTLSAHPFEIQLPKGKYTLTVERGKEYFTETKAIVVGDQPLDVEIPIKRWVHMASQGWFSGDTHVHRKLDELPNAMLAEDLNVALPLVDWTTEAYLSPRKSRPATFQDVEPRLVEVDAQHVYFPRNTEYELFTIDQKPHTQGAFFVLNHRNVLELGAPPVRPIAEQARREGALIDLDKHNWPWSMMLIPVIQPDLFELSNNHIWRTQFAAPVHDQPAAPYMQAERNEHGFTERGWLEFGWQNYYALLNCGFRMRPSGGTASGVHPVPLGFSRVYVHCGDQFSYETWLAGLNLGRSFVTNGPMLLAQFNGQLPGHTFDLLSPTAACRIQATVVNSQPLDRIEIILNGEIVRSLQPANERTSEKAYEIRIDETIKILQSSWIALRCFEQRSDSRVRFAHTAPVHFDILGKPLRPRRVEIDYLIERVQEQITRNSSVLPEESLQEYRVALQAYQEIAKNARQ